MSETVWNKFDTVAATSIIHSKVVNQFNFKTVPFKAQNQGIGLPFHPVTKIATIPIKVLGHSIQVQTCVTDPAPLDSFILGRPTQVHYLKSLLLTTQQVSYFTYFATPNQ